MRHVFSLCIALMIGAPTAAETLDLLVDPAAAGAGVDVCVTLTNARCGHDDAPMSGFLSVTLDCPAHPGEVTVRGFHVEALEEVELVLNFGLGTIVITGTDVEATYGEPDPPIGPLAVEEDGSFFAPSVEIMAAGQGTFQATGLVCIGLLALGYECEGAVDLATIEVPPVTLTGTIDADGERVDVHFSLSGSAVLDPLDPESPTVSAAVTTTAGALLPAVPCCPGDLDGDELVDIADHARLQGCLADPGTAPMGACACADLSADDSVDLADFALFENLLEHTTR